MTYKLAYSRHLFYYDIHKLHFEKYEIFLFTRGALDVKLLSSCFR